MLLKNKKNIINFKWKPSVLLLLISMILCSSCVPSLITSYQGVSQTGKSIDWMEPLDGITPTPYQPIKPTPTYIPTLLPTSVPTPIPEKKKNSSREPQAANPLKLPENQINVLLLGSDRNASRTHYRTDSIILVSINTTAKKISMISFPRDLYIYIPGWTYERINTAMFHGGFDLMAKTLEYNFGVSPDYYIMVNFKAFREIINRLGGIDVNVPKAYVDQYWDNTQKKIPAGNIHMDGATALWYARARKASNDFDRARRQQEVLHAIAKKALSMNALESAKDLYQIYIDNVTTNLKWYEIAPLIPLIVHFKDPSLIHSYYVGPGEVYDWITPGGGMVLLPRQEKIIKLLKNALGAQ